MILCIHTVERFTFHSNVVLIYVVAVDGGVGRILLIRVVILLIAVSVVCCCCSADNREQVDMLSYDHKIFSPKARYVKSVHYTI